MTYKKILEQALSMRKNADTNNTMLIYARIMAFAMDNCEIFVPETATFFVSTNIAIPDARILHKVRQSRVTRPLPYRNQAADEAVESCAYFGTYDTGHTAPDWPTVYELGLEGLKQRILNRTGRTKNKDYKEATLTVLEAAQRFALRAAETAKAAGREQMAKGLAHLATGTPRDLFEGFQLSLLYYHLQQFFECSDVRTLGRLDALLMPYLAKETDKAYVQQLAERFLQEINDLKAIANMPFALGGTDLNGKCAINPMSYVLLDAYKATMGPDVKLHILCSEDMPESFLLSCMDSIKRGGNSLVFVNDKQMVSGLIKLGMDPEDAAQYTIVGCYESAARNEIPCSCSTRLSLPKALEYTLHAGCDMVTGYQVGLPIEPNFESFEALYDAFLQNLQHLINGAVGLTRCAESQMPDRHAAPLYSAVLSDCVAQGGDIYVNFSARYNNSSLVAVGIGTTTDSLYAIRHLVYEKKQLTLSQLIEILDQNWEGQEPLRQFIRNKLPKYGCGDTTVDDIAADIAQKLSQWVNGLPNARGGVYRLSIFSIDWRSEWGKKTGASADGRKTGDTLSQNASATFGMDREGPTGHIQSVTRLPGEDAVNGLVMDMELHSSAVAGENGTQVLLSILKTFFQKGGQTIHYNVLDTEILKDAQIHPEKYTNLQVRVCGWNADFTKMTKAEQDEYIVRSQMQMR